VTSVLVAEATSGQVSVLRGKLTVLLPLAGGATYRLLAHRTSR
jgi:hypothetical protein